jgi:hypothetical protein
LYGAVSEGFALTATSFFFCEKRKTKQKESSPYIIFILCSSLQSDALFKAKLSPSFQARLRNSLRSNSARLHRLSTALLGDNEGVERLVLCIPILLATKNSLKVGVLNNVQCI